MFSKLIFNMVLGLFLFIGLPILAYLIGYFLSLGFMRGCLIALDKIGQRVRKVTGNMNTTEQELWQPDEPRNNADKNGV